MTVLFSSNDETGRVRVCIELIKEYFGRHLCVYIVCIYDENRVRVVAAAINPLVECWNLEIVVRILSLDAPANLWKSHT